MTRIGTRQRRSTLIAGWGLIALLLAVTLLPFLWAIRTALTDNADLFSGSISLIPEQPTLINYRRVLGLTTPEENIAAGGTAATMNFWLYLRNSLVFVALLVAGQMITATMAAYALSRLRFPGRDLLFVVILTGLMIPPIFIVLPNFILIHQLEWLNSFQGLLAPYFFISPFAVFFLRQFMLGLPREVEEAAMLDGASRWRVFSRIIVPMAAPPITTLAIIQAVFAWNEYLWPQLVARGDGVRVLNVALAMFSQASPPHDLTGPASWRLPLSRSCPCSSCC